MGLILANDIWGCSGYNKARMKRIRITYIVNCITQLGGIERVVSMLSGYFVEKFNYEVSIVSLNTKKGEKTGFVFNEKIKIEHCGYPESEYGNRYLLDKRIRKFLKEEEVQETDIIIASHGNIADLIALNRRLFSGKIIFTEHSSWEFYTKARKIIQTICYKQADRLVVLSDEAAKDYRKHGLKNVTIIPNAVREIPNFKDKGHEKHLLLAIGRIEDVKGYDNLILAIDSVKEKLGDWKVEIYGTGSKEEELKSKIKAFSVEKYVKIAGPTNEVLDKLHEASGYLLTSRNEAFPMVVLESLACGTPVVAYSLPIIKEMNRKNMAILEVSPRDDYRAFGEAITNFIENAKQRQALSKASLELAKEYSLDNISEQWRRLFRELLGRD